MNKYKEIRTLENRDLKPNRLAKPTRLAGCVGLKPTGSKKANAAGCVGSKPTRKTSTLGHGDQKQKRFAELTRLAVSKPTS